MDLGDNKAIDRAMYVLTKLKKAQVLTYFFQVIAIQIHEFLIVYLFALQDIRNMCFTIIKDGSFIPKLFNKEKGQTDHPLIHRHPL